MSCHKVSNIMYPFLHFTHYWALAKIGLLLSMSSYQVAMAFDLRPTLFDKALFDVGPGQMRCGRIPVHRFVVPEAEVLRSKPPLGVEVDDITRPSSAVSPQDVLLLAVDSRTGSEKSRE